MAMAQHITAVKDFTPLFAKVFTVGSGWLVIRGTVNDFWHELVDYQAKVDIDQVAEALEINPTLPEGVIPSYTPVRPGKQCYLELQNQCLQTVYKCSDRLRAAISEVEFQRKEMQWMQWDLTARLVAIWVLVICLVVVFISTGVSYFQHSKHKFEAEARKRGTQQSASTQAATLTIE